MRIDFTYLADDQVANEKFYNDLAGTQKAEETDYTYDAAGNVTNILHIYGGGGILANYTYTYDLAGNVTTDTDNGTTVTYTYDATNQLTAGNGTNYSYDSNGNRTMSGYVTGKGNQLISDGTWTYTYDAEGNLTTKKNLSTGETWTYGYDDLNRLIWDMDRTVDGGGTLLYIATMTYDVFNNRIEMDWTQGGTTTTQRYAYNGDEVWADLTGANALELRYVLGDQTDQLLARVNETTGSLAYYLTDDLGSVRLIMDSSGTVLNAITYDAYGNILTQSNASYSDRYKYTGREFDPVSGLQYNRGRYYNASTGSRLSQDPLGFTGGDSNLYRYVGNDPTGLTDPNGTADTAIGRSSGGHCVRGDSVAPSRRGMRVGAGIWLLARQDIGSGCLRHPRWPGGRCSDRWRHGRGSGGDQWWTAHSGLDAPAGRRPGCWESFAGRDVWGSVDLPYCLHLGYEMPSRRQSEVGTHDC